jgi:deoxyribonuclease V
MPYIAVDVSYQEEGGTAVALVFDKLEDDDFMFTMSIGIVGGHPYVPGNFYKRELPHIRTVVNLVVSMSGTELLEEPLANLRLEPEEIDAIFIDGYVDLDDDPGLGRHVYGEFDGVIPIIGVAKTKFKGVRAAEVLRGKSKKPLFVTAAGMSREDAAAMVADMHGPYRMPTLLKETDRLTRIRPANT